VFANEIENDFTRNHGEFEGTQYVETANTGHCERHIWRKSF
jgi:hypothetical protein